MNVKSGRELAKVGGGVSVVRTLGIMLVCAVVGTLAATKAEARGADTYQCSDDNMYCEVGTAAACGVSCGGHKCHCMQVPQ